MKKKIVLISPLFFVLLIIVIGAILISFDYKKEPQACVENHCFNVELAQTPEEQKRGLMFRERLDSDEGMLFVFEKEAEYPFWMKNTLMTLDIIWINGNRETVFIYENAQPCKEDKCFSINPGKNAKYVLEIAGGMAQEIGLEVGDKINLKELE